MVKFGLVLIYVKKVLLQKILFDFTEEKYIQLITYIFLLKSMYLFKF